MKLCLMSLLAIATLAVACRAPEPSCPLRKDLPPVDGETLEASCARASANVKTVCPASWTPYFSETCIAHEREGVAFCPRRLAVAKTCAEVDEVCR